MSMKYVAFLDILGFKEKLNTMKHGEARPFIGHFRQQHMQLGETWILSIYNSIL